MPIGVALEAWRLAGQVYLVEHHDLRNGLRIDLRQHTIHLLDLLKPFGPVHTVDVLTEPGVRDGIKAFSNWPTIPQIYINGKFVGGSDILTELAERGELEALVKG